MACLRRNNSESVTCDPCRIIGTGTFKKVCLATYNDGVRRGSLAAVKHFKFPSVIEQSYFDHKMNIIKVSAALIDGFNKLGCLDKSVSISLNEPQIWWDLETRETCLIEPFIVNYEKYNSNTGWVNPDSKPWNSAMQALSHFSYHITKGNSFIIIKIDLVIFSRPDAVVRLARWN